jgi:hypothetical protein
LALKAPLALPALLALKEPLALLALKVLPALLVLLALLALVAPLALLALTAPLVLPVLKARRVKGAGRPLRSRQWRLTPVTISTSNPAQASRWRWPLMRRTAPR